MEIWTLIGYIRDAIKEDSTISAWCDTNYDTGHSVFIGYDEENPPAQSDYPIIVIIPTQQDRNLNTDYGPMIIEIGYGLVDENKTVSGNVTTFDGVQNILAFRAVVESVLFDLNPSVDLGGAWIEGADELIEPVEAFPVFISNVLYTFRNPDRFTTLLSQT